MSLVLTTSSNTYVIGTTTVTIKVNNVSPSLPTGLLVPLYSYPTPGAWDALVAAKILNPSVPMVAVVNPNDGPGTSVDPSYSGGIDYLRGNKITVLGYVATTYANKPASTVQAEIDLWKQFYPVVDGIFFDEMSGTQGQESYYSQLSAYARSKGFGFTVGNPGTTVPSTFVGTVDNIVISESATLPVFVSSLSSKSGFSFIAYSQPTLPGAGYMTNAKAAVGFLYITDAGLPNPYNGFPSYLAQLVASLV